MALDGITVANIAYELKQTLSEGRIHKIAQPENDELLLTFKIPGGQRRLCMSASASLPLIYLTDTNKPSPMTAPNFCMLLRKHINNGRIMDIVQPNFERILEFHIDHLDELGDLCRKILIIELMGRHSNIIFCNDDYTIIDSIKRVSSQISSVREVLPGRTYFVPDTMQKLNPLTVTKEDFMNALIEKPMPVSKAMNASFTGISYVVAEEICTIASIDSRLPATELSEDIYYHLFRQFELYFEQVKVGQFSPTIYYNGIEPREFCGLPLSHFEASDPKYFTSMSEVLETYYSSKNTLTRIRQKSVDLRHVVQVSLERNRKKYDLQLKQIKDTENRDKFKVYGELIHTYGYGLESGAKKLDALNYYTNEMISIPLDSTKTAMENAQKYFDKYNKQKRTFEALSEFVKGTKEEIEYLESVSTALEIARTEDDLIQIKEELTNVGYVKRKFSKKKVKILSKPLHYISSDGYHMYVGKNNLQNEEITFTLAEGNDWWFHAKGVPGSHVVVKIQDGEMPDRTFEEAGKLAAYYSKNRGNDKVEIDYIEKKHVKKPKGGKPGFVVYYTNYSLIIDSDISMLQEI
ncbi:MAG: NFACT RNA binding domain-containing protein [Eubacteriales bacterium]